MKKIFILVVHFTFLLSLASEGWGNEMDQFNLMSPKTLIAANFSKGTDNFSNNINDNFYLYKFYSDDYLPIANTNSDYDNAAQSAYHAVALAEEAHLAIKNKYTEDYNELKSEAGLVIDDNIEYSEIEVYSSAEGSGKKCFVFNVSHKKGSIIYFYDSCEENNVKFLDKSLYLKAYSDNAAQSAYHAVALAEEAHFAIKNKYTENYNDLKSEAGLVLDDNVEYGEIDLYTSLDSSMTCFKFSVTHKKGSKIYFYDSCSENIIKFVDKKLHLNDNNDNLNDNYDNAAQSAYHAVALAEEAHFAMENTYSISYDSLISNAGLVLDDNIEYGEITLYTSNVTSQPCFKFSLSHKEGSKHYSYDSCSKNTVIITDKTTAPKTPNIISPPKIESPPKTESPAKIESPPKTDSPPNTDSKSKTNKLFDSFERKARGN